MKPRSAIVRKRLRSVVYPDWGDLRVDGVPFDKWPTQCLKDYLGWLETYWKTGRPATPGLRDAWESNGGHLPWHRDPPPSEVVSTVERLRALIKEREE